MSICPRKKKNTKDKTSISDPKSRKNISINSKIWNNQYLNISWMEKTNTYLLIEIKNEHEHEHEHEHEGIIW